MSQYTGFENYTDDELIKLGLASTPLAVELAQRLEAAGDNDERIGELEKANDQLEDRLFDLRGEIEDLEAKNTRLEERIEELSNEAA